MLFYHEICFAAIYALFVWRKIEAKNVPCGEKMTNMMNAEKIAHLTWLRYNWGSI